MNELLCARDDLRAVMPAYEFHGLDEHGTLTGCVSRTEPNGLEPESHYCEGCRQHFDTFDAALEHLPSDTIDQDDRALNLTRQQIKALIDVIAGDRMKPELRRAVVTKYQDAPYLTATDGHILVALRLGTSYEAEVGECVEHDALVRWYKLAAPRDEFDDATLQELLRRNDMAFPSWQQLVPEESQAAERLRFNAALANKLQGVSCQPITYRLTGQNGAMIGEDDKALYMLMPCKTA